MRCFLDFQNRYGLDFIFYILNVISKLAYKENAVETENTVCDFSDMMRYLSDNSHNRFVSLEEELKYLNCFAAIQRRRLDGHFDCAISVPTKYYSVPCPFMLLHAVLENVFKYNPDVKDLVKITVTGKESEGAFLLEIESRGLPFDDEQMKLALSLEELEETQSGKVVLSTLNRRIKGLFGEAYGIFLQKAEGDYVGGNLRVRLPLSSGGMVK